jgi:hypothetical protein
MKRVVWIWLAEAATENERNAWQQFVKVNMRVSEAVRFLVAETQADLDFKADTLQKAGWSFGRQGDGWMARVYYFCKEDNES